MRVFRIYIYTIILFTLFSLTAYAEENSNYADCDVCHGSIHLTIPETRGLLGIKGANTIKKLPLPYKRQIKIDLDRILINGTKDTPNEGYEIMIWGSVNFIIKSLVDRSSIFMVTSRRQLSNYEESHDHVYQPHIYLSSGHDDEIALDDSIEIAWEKMKFSKIYQWVGKADTKEEWLNLLGGKILQSMELVIAKN